MTPNEYADFWRYEVGVNVIPANSKQKIPLTKWTEYQNNPIPKEIHDEWKKENKFNQGLAVICGQVFHNDEHKGKWLNGIDCDNKLGLEKLCPVGINSIALITIVEQHANKEKGHIYFYTSEPIKSKSANDGKNNTVPQIEVKSGGKFLLYCAGSIHKDNSPIEILGIKQVKTVDKESLEFNINEICKEFQVPYLEGIAEIRKPVSEMIKDDFVIYEGGNRSEAILRYLSSKKIKNPEFTLDDLYRLGKQFNEKHCKPPYSDYKVKQDAKQSLGYGEEKIKENKQNDDSEEKIPPTIQSYNVGKSLIKKVVKSENDTEQIVIQIELDEKPHWIDVNSPTFNQMVRVNTQKHFQKIYGEGTYETAIKNLYAEALLNGTETRPVFNRCALVDDVLYYDLQDKQGTIFKVSKDEIKEAQDDEDIPIFLKSPSAKTKASTQLHPSFDNDNALDEFVKLCRVSDDDKIIFKSHLASYFLTSFPIPIAVFHGEHGSGKTVVSGSVKSLVDPEGENAMGLTQKIDDMAVTLSRHNISNFDNTENFSNEISHFLCQVVTGTQFIKRKFFTNGGEFSLSLKSKVILNGISPSIVQPDLIERCIFYELPRVPEGINDEDDEFKEKIIELRPYVIGVIFKAIQNALKIKEQVHDELKENKKIPRMSTFAVWGEAISRSLGHEKNAFIDSYLLKVADSNLALSEEYPIIEPLLKYIENKTNEDIPIKELFNSIIDPLSKDERLPKDSKILGKQLRQLSPTLRTFGYETRIKKHNKRDSNIPRGSTIVNITKISEDGVDTFA